MKNFRPILITANAFFIISKASFAISPYECDGGKNACSFTDTSLPVRVVVRPASSLIDEASEDAGVLNSNLPAFRPWYVYDSVGIDYTDPKNPKGFYQVGVTRDSGPRGWMAAKDTFIWKSNIVVTYAPRDSGSENERSRVILFDDLDKAKNLLESSDPGVSYSEIAHALSTRDHTLLEKAGVVLAEPKVEVSFQNGFYIMPVIDHKELPIGLGVTARYLQIAAAVPQTEDDLGRDVTTIRDADTLENIEQGAGAALGQVAAASNAVFDIVFAIDMTGSMRPYINATAQSVTQIVGEIERAGLSDAVNYGLVGYTDIKEECAACRFYEAKKLTPELGSGDKISEILTGEDWASDGGDLEESVFAGVREAISSTNWSENSLKFVIVIGDAMSREKLDDGSPITADYITSLAANSASDGRIQVVALHAKPRGTPRENRKAEAQFRKISMDPAGQSSQYFGFEVDQSNSAAIENAFKTTLRKFLSDFVPAIKAIRDGNSEEILAIIEAAKKIDREKDLSIEDLGEAALAPQLVEYLGTAKERPRDLVAWTTDIDPAEPETSSLEVRVLLDKRELSDLVATMTKVQRAYLAAELTGGKFFDELQAVEIGKALDVETRDSSKIAKSGLAPRWIETLPYKSRLLAMSPEVFANMDASQREDFEIDLDVKISILNAYLNNPDIWEKMAPDVSDLSAVFPVPLNDLP